MSKKGTEPKADELRFILDKAGQSQVIYNVSQEYVTITTDKIRICIRDHIQNLGRRREWTTPLGILLTIFVTLATTTFNNAFFNASTWQAIFVVSAIVTSIWLAWSLIRIPKAENEEDIIRALKKGSGEAT